MRFLKCLFYEGRLGTVGKCISSELKQDSEPINGISIQQVHTYNNVAYCGFYVLAETGHYLPRDCGQR